MFGITAGYHRLFSHRSYKTSRVFQFLLAFLGASAGQQGPLWWAAQHRHHHRHSDDHEDIHSPRQGGFWWSHIGWVVSDKFVGYDRKAVRDLARYPELGWLDRHHVLAPLSLASGSFLLGTLLQHFFPSLGTSGGQMVTWGYCIASTLAYHATFTVNSLAHILGSRRFQTTDDSRNCAWIALFTFGEGWHNNHHRYPGSARQGLTWWEIDITYGVLKVLSWLGLVWELRSPPARVFAKLAVSANNHSFDASSWTPELKMPEKAGSSQSH